MRTSNPALKAFLKPEILAGAPANTMTFGGTLLKTGILLCLCSFTAVSAYTYMQGARSGSGELAILGSALAALILGWVISLAPRTAPFIAPIYALLEGAVVGLVSYVVPQHFHGKVDPGLIMQAVLLTFGIAAAVLVSFSLGMVRLSSTAAKVVIVATLGVSLYYSVVILLGLFGLGTGLSLGWSAGPAGIAFSLFVVVLASINLVLDFQFIEAGVTNGAPRHMEWYGAFGLMVTLVWLYFEVLRLLSKLQKR